MTLDGVNVQRWAQSGLYFIPAYQGIVNVFAHRWRARAAFLAVVKARGWGKG